jgi:hypothetical protein
VADPDWTNTRAALGRLNPLRAAAAMPKLMLKGPGLIKTGQGLLKDYSFQDDKFKILMLHELKQELPDFEELYQAILTDIMADKTRLG